MTVARVSETEHGGNGGRVQKQSSNPRRQTRHHDVSRDASSADRYVYGDMLPTERGIPIEHRRVNLHRAFPKSRVPPSVLS